MSAADPNTISTVVVAVVAVATFGGAIAKGLRSAREKDIQDAIRRNNTEQENRRLKKENEELRAKGEPDD